MVGGRSASNGVVDDPGGVLREDGSSRCDLNRYGAVDKGCLKCLDTLGCWVEMGSSFDSSVSLAELAAPQVGLSI